MARKPTNHSKSGDIDYDQLWAESQAEQGKKEEARRRAWLAWMKENGDRAPYSPWLVIPANLGDYGVRPLPSGTPYWASPFIWVDSPSPSGDPVAGAENYLVAQVFNLGAATAAPTKVDFYWADPSVGLGPGDFTLVGTEWVEVPSMNSKIVTCSTPWIPSYLNNGHECAMVNCDNHVLDPILDPFHPWNDRHVGQRNLHVLPPVPQKFFLWAPMSVATGQSEIRVLALRGVAPKGFKRLKTAYQTVTMATQEVLRGLRQSPAAAMKAMENRVVPTVFAERIDPERLLDGIRVLDDKRILACSGMPDRRCMEYGVNGADLGDLALRLPEGPGAAVRLELNLRAMDLAMNEIVILNIAHVAMGFVTGGYTIAVVNAAWFEGSPITAKGGGLVRGKEDNRLEQLVITHNAEARITYQLARQLERLLPIRSMKEVTEELREGVLIEGHRLPVEIFTPHIPHELFPIEDADDLVKKMSAATRIALSSIQSASSDNIHHAAVRDILGKGIEGDPGRRSAIPSGHFVGPSLFGSTPAKGGK